MKNLLFMFISPVPRNILGIYNSVQIYLMSSCKNEGNDSICQKWMIIFVIVLFLFSSFSFWYIVVCLLILISLLAYMGLESSNCLFTCLSFLSFLPAFLPSFLPSSLHGFLLFASFFAFYISFLCLSRCLSLNKQFAELMWEEIRDNRGREKKVEG